MVKLPVVEHGGEGCPITAKTPDDNDLNWYWNPDYPWEQRRKPFIKLLKEDDVEIDTLLK